MTVDQLELETPNNPPRMVMVRMVLENFKSYAGRIEIGPFHKSFTAIVGANGSGKSNVIDALLFVFGFKAKKMRQEKLAGLIHHSASFPDLTYCQVEVHFKEIVDTSDGGFEDITGSDLVITRKATKDKSQYYVNGKTSSYTEVTTLLREKGVDLDHKRFLILQGEVESISQMKPTAQNENDEGLLEYLEDIIGTSKYKEPIEESFKEMERLNEIRAEKLNRIKIAEGEVKALESKKKEAEDYLEDENKLVRTKNKFYQFCIWDSHERLQELENDAAEVNATLIEQEDALKQKTEEMKLKQEEYDQLNNDYLTVKNQAELAQKQFSKYERDFIQIEEKKKHLKQKIKKLEKQIEKEKLSKSESDVWVKNHTSDLEKKKGILSKYMETFADAENELNSIRQELNGKTESIQQEIDSKKEDLAPWNHKISDKKSEINILQRKIDLLREKLESDDKVVKEAEKMLSETTAALTSKRKLISHISSSHSNTQKSLDEKVRKLDNLKQQEYELRSTVIDISQQLETTKSSAHAASSRSELVKLLLNERDSGRIPGICGPLSELGTIDDKYDVAISSAYAERLKWIVVDTVATAEKCLKILKAKSAGRASFIVMERLAEVTEKKKTPENAPKLIDLIKPTKPIYRKAFYHVVKDTLVADDLDQANRIAFGPTRWKVVTLDGKVIDKAGTMSGGGNKQARGALSKHAVAEYSLKDCPAMESLKEQREAELKECREEIVDLAKSVESLKKEMTKMEQEKFELESEITGLEGQIKTLQKTLSSTSKKSSGANKSDEKEIVSLEKQIATLKQDECELIKTAQVIQLDIGKLQNKILEIGGDRLRRQNSRVNDLKEEIDLLQESIAHIEGQLKSTEKTQGKSKNTLSKFEEELEGAREELKSVEAELETKQEASSDIRKKCEEAGEFVESKKETLRSLKSQVESFSTELNALRSQKIEAENAAMDVNKTLQELNKRVSNWKAAKQKLKLQSIDCDIGESSEGKNDSLPELVEEELKELNKDKLVKEITILEENIAQAQPNLTVLAEYRERYKEYMTRVRDMEIITEQRDASKNTYDEFRRKRFDEFMAGFTLISRKLKEMYQMITLGGNAELELVDSLDPFSEGIMFSVMPPKKSWKNISNLSGGEKTLSSLALVFALHHFKPTPLYVMDEIDAALDFRNVSIIANYISERTKNAQFVIISLRNNMFELADRLVGIYKTDNTTKSIAINPRAIVTA